MSQPNEHDEHNGQQIQGPGAGGDDPELDPYEINFLPEFRSGRGPRAPFVNSSGVVIGDHAYESPESPLSSWTEETDPAVMAGSEWVHPFKDIGFQTSENREYFEQGIEPEAGIFAHPDKDAAYEAMDDAELDDDPQ
ncbi:DUF3905 domain-containing protein [Paenibacillus sacheonensis]|uniref:DUF3905 domain-containing protein n=1 Tax=Paenibacillus sacheonensis TaxID=742054 RepID=A0A7X5BYV6_9BACL|nr:DUF3905 domain-containing protein [Paenibacillus sacheonensis]MBM7567722.1 hypothetical protein [Paenibacillus sacheonensis]NBC72003.1 DUF3905 domain-containing protein [Paenibacillus sacheonensis]